MPEVYEVTLLITREDGDPHPQTWDWGALMDDAYPVLVEHTELVKVNATTDEYVD